MSSEQILQWVVVAGGSIVVVEVIRSFVQRRKMGADAAKVITDAAAALVAPMQERIKQLEPLQDKVTALERTVERLTRTVERQDAEILLLQKENQDLRLRARS